MSLLGKQTNLRGNSREVGTDYGGWKTLLSSGYFWLSAIIAVTLWPVFESGEWADWAVDIIPTVLGLTLAGAAILTTIGGDSFRERLAQIKGSTGQEAPILELLSNFIFAMIIQLCALVFSLIFEAKPFRAAWLRCVGFDEEFGRWINFAAGAFGSLLLVYGIFLILGAAFTVRALASVYVRDARAELGDRPK